MYQKDILHLIPNWFTTSNSYYAIVIDWQGNYIYTNALFQKRFSFLNHGFLGKHCSDSIHPDDWQNVEEVVKKCIAEPDKSFQIQLRKPTSESSTYFWTSWDFALLKDAKGNAIGIICIGHDISHVQALEMEVSKVKHQVATVINNITDGFYMLNQKWEFIEVNPTAELILGKSKSELSHKVIWEVFPETQNTNMHQLYVKAIQDQKTCYFEVFHPYLSRWYEITAYPAKDLLVVFFKDVTERHWIEEKLRYSEHKLRAILDSTTDSNILISPYYKILALNKVTEVNVKMYWGKDIREGDSILDYIVPGTEEDFKSDFQKSLQGEIIHIEKELEFAKNHKIWFRISYYPVYDKKGKLLGVSFNSTNIDKEKRAEQKIIDSQHKLTAIYNSYTDSHILLDTKHNIISFNKVARNLIRTLFDTEIKEGMSFIPFIFKGAESEFYENFQKALDGEKIEIQRKRYFPQLERKIWFLIRYTPVYDQDRQIIGVAVNSINISQIKEAEEKIAKQNDTLRKIAWIQSHQVRRPLANILGLIQLIRDDVGKKYQERYLDYLLKASQELDEIIHEIVKSANEVTEKDIVEK